MIEHLRRVDLFEGLPEERLAEIAARAVEETAAEGEILIAQGDVLDRFTILVEGRVEWVVEVNGRRTAVGQRDAVSYFGATSLLLDEASNGTGRAAAPSRLVHIRGDDFRVLLRDEPEVLRRVVQLIAPIQRSVEAALRQREKLASLGTLAAGLAHELNNPAAAARRSARELVGALEILQSTVDRFVSSGVEREQAERLVGLQKEALAASSAPSTLSALELADREDVLAEILDGLGLESRRLAPPLAEAGLDAAWLAAVAELAGQATDAAVEWVVASLTARGLAAELEASAIRISEIVSAVKEYTYMDRGELQEVDVNDGLETTLTILRHKLKEGSVVVVRELDPDLPRVFASGSELNQVWTNLIVNALDALAGSGTLTLRTRARRDAVVVEVADDGPGIPPDVESRIFEPFFTTKGVGDGTGLGLDISRRIVQFHGGELTVESRPGSTVFAVTLPRERAA